MQTFHTVIQIPERQIRATYNEKTIRVYQAYSDLIADTALEKGTFRSPPFKMQRMTWIKPSFLWMMYRSGWGFKDSGQSRILAIDISREGFEWALKHSCLSHADDPLNNQEWEILKEKSDVRIQWDPERNLLLQPLHHRTIQVGLGVKAVNMYVNQWISKITDITEVAHTIHKLVQLQEFTRAAAMLPVEIPYPT